MAVKIDDKRFVADWRLADELFKMLSPGVYYLTLVTQWDGMVENKPQIALIKEGDNGRLSGMTIEDPTSLEGLRAYAEAHNFEPTDEKKNVFVLRKQ